MFALVPFIKGDFVVEYRGEIITLIEAELRKKPIKTLFLCSTSSGRTRSGGTFFLFFFYQYILKLQ